MQIRRAFVFKLEPTSEQRQKFARFAGCCRKVYNDGLAFAEKQYEEKTDWKLTKNNLVKLLPTFKKDLPYLKETYSQCLQQSMMHLGDAYIRFFKGLAGHPTFHKKFASTDAFTFPQNFKIFEDRQRLYLPGIGEVRYRRSRFMTGLPRNITVRRKADSWYVSIQCQWEIEDRLHPNLHSEIGVDLGVKRLATISEAEFYQMAGPYRKYEEKLQKLQKKLDRKRNYLKARQKKGEERLPDTQNIIKMKVRIARLHKRIADIRHDFIHKVTTRLAKNHGTIWLEDLEIKNMTKSASGTKEEPGKNVSAKSGLNKSILDCGWGMFKTFLAYKVQERGGTIGFVNPQNTSRTCPACGHVSKENRPTQAKFKCVKCGFSGNADAIAAENIRRAGHARIAGQANG